MNQMIVPPSLAEWTRIPDFDGSSREHRCSTSGQPKRPGEPVFRGALIDMEGFYDICLDSALQLGKIAGLVEANEADKAIARQLELEEELAEARRRLGKAEAVIDAWAEFDEVDS